MKLSITKTKSKNDIEDIYKHNTSAFTDNAEIDWSLDSLLETSDEGWDIYSASCDDNIVAALFVKKGPDTLITKNTPIRIEFQGNGFSHMIKEFYEEEAKKRGLDRLLNYCSSSNFRMMSLNEGHNYKKTGRTVGDSGEIIEWEKVLDNN